MFIAIISIMFGVLLGTGLSMLGILFVLRFIEHKHLGPDTLASLKEEPGMMS